MGLASEYVEDGGSFITIDPLSINPDYLASFSLFERYDAGEKNKYRFRCLLVDTASMPKERLMELLRFRDAVYVHKNQAQKYSEYIKDNLEFILNHDEIDSGNKAKTLVAVSTNVVKDSFTVKFSSEEECRRVVRNVQQLITRAIDFISSIESLKGVADLVGHDYDTHTHSIKVGWLVATFISSNQDLFEAVTRDELKSLMIQSAVAGFLHDIGKVKIPKNVINKRGKLNNLEYITMQAHTAYSVSLLFESQLPKSAIQAILYHHENEDGSGYPCGLAGDQIPMLAKICHIADVFDALTSRRPYKEPKTPLQALKIMVGENPYLDSLQKFEAEANTNRRVPVVTRVRDDYDAKLKRLREKEMLEEEAAKRVEARHKLRDQGMLHCFDKDLLKRFIMTINRSSNFDLSGLV